jgi:hypothetical protein
MFTFETHVGSRRGGWIRSAARFDTAAGAATHADSITRSEALAGAHRFIRRVVPA